MARSSYPRFFVRTGDLSLCSGVAYLVFSGQNWGSAHKSPAWTSHKAVLRAISDSEKKFDLCMGRGVSTNDHDEGFHSQVVVVLDT